MKNGKGATTRTRWTAEVAQQELERWRASGLALEAYARQRGLVSQRLRWWRQQLGDEAAAPPLARGTLVPVVVRGVAGADVDVALVLELEDGGRLEVREVSSATAAWVGTLLATLRSARA